MSHEQGVRVLSRMTLKCTTIPQSIRHHQWRYLQVRGDPVGNEWAMNGHRAGSEYQPLSNEQGVIFLSRMTLKCTTIPQSIRHHQWRYLQVRGDPAGNEWAMSGH